MPVFAYSIAADQDSPSEGDGYVRAETIHEAVALVGYRHIPDMVQRCVERVLMTQSGSSTCLRFQPEAKL